LRFLGKFLLIFAVPLTPAVSPLLSYRIMALELFKPFYIWFGLTNQTLAFRLDVDISTIEKHQTSPTMRWRPQTAMKLVGLMAEYLDRLNEVAPSRRQTIIDGLREAIQQFPNEDIRPLMEEEVDRAAEKLGLQ
jgi:hypothetical protein